MRIAAINYRSKVLNAMRVWWNINTFNVRCQTRKCNNSKALRLPHSQVHWACIFILSIQKLTRIDYQGQVFPHECPHSATFEKSSLRAEICTQYFDAKITNVCEFPHGNLTFDKTQTGFEFSTRSSAAVIYLFSSDLLTTNKHQEYIRERARAGEIFERPASFVCMSQPVALLLVLFRRLAPYLQLSSVFLLWHVDTRFFSFYYTTHQRAASKPSTPCTMVRDVHLFGGAGLCSLGALTHTAQAGALELWPPALFVYLP